MDIGGYPEQVHLGVKWISIGYPFLAWISIFLCYGELLIYPLISMILVVVDVA